MRDRIEANEALRALHMHGLEGVDSSVLREFFLKSFKELLHRDAKTNF